MSAHSLVHTEETSGSIIEAMESTDSIDSEDLAAEYLLKLEAVTSMLSADLLACDAMWTLFVAAAMSYRYEELLNPFPPQFKRADCQKDIELLLMVINDTPKLHVLLSYLKEKDYKKCHPFVIGLLYWVLIELKDPTMRIVGGREYYRLLRNITQNVNVEPPTHVFQICYSILCRAEETFKNRSTNYETKFLFCGCSADHVYSIICNGFEYGQVKQSQLDMNARQIHLTSDLTTSLTHSTAMPCWGASSLGAVLRCVLVCEIINRSEYLNSCVDLSRSNVNVLLENADTIRPRYIIFYGKRFPTAHSKYRTLLKWFTSNKHLVSVSCYLLLFGTCTFLSGRKQFGNTFYFKHTISQVFYGFRHVLIRSTLKSLYPNMF